jgi:hypothetical protein
MIDTQQQYELGPAELETILKSIIKLDINPKNTTMKGTHN